MEALKPFIHKLLWGECKILKMDAILDLILVWYVVTLHNTNPMWKQTVFQKLDLIVGVFSSFFCSVGIFYYLEP